MNNMGLAEVLFTKKEPGYQNSFIGSPAIFCFLQDPPRSAPLLAKSLAFSGFIFFGL
jgi:hypothetical protein